MQENMVSLTDVAAELGINVATVHRYIKRLGLTTYKKIGDRRGFLRREDLERLKGFTPRERVS